LGTAKFCFYLTWKKPEDSKFEDAADKSVSMQIKFNANSKKPNILETLLWLGCDLRYNKSLIVVQIFKCAPKKSG
jgi:hypothetical protein